MKCLLVDESSLTRRIVLRALSSLGHRDVIEVSDGVEALQHCDESVGLVITDWHLPTMSGVDLVRHLRANPATANVPVIMVTSRNLRENVEEAVEAGVNGYLLKPVGAEALRRKIEELTGSADAELAGGAGDGAAGEPDGGPGAAASRKAA